MNKFKNTLLLALLAIGLVIANSAIADDSIEKTKDKAAGTNIPNGRQVGDDKGNDKSTPAPVYATKLQLDAEATRATGVEGTLTKAIGDERTRAMAAEASAARTTGTHVIDANGMDLGMLLGSFSNTITTYIESIGKSTTILMNYQNKVEVASIDKAQYKYTNDTCTGTPVNVVIINGDSQSPPPNNVSGIGFFPTIYSETDSTTGYALPTGNYIEIGPLLDTEANPAVDGASITATSHIIASIPGSDMPELYTGRTIHSNSGCTAIPTSLASILYPPSSCTGGGMTLQGPCTYDGYTFSGYSAAYSWYMSRINLYNNYSRNNSIPPGKVRFVNEIATTSAPFPNPIKLPLSFQ